jgi:hypothetical protein
MKGFAKTSLFCVCLLVPVLAAAGCGKPQAEREKELTKNFKGGPMPADVQQRMNAAMAKSGQEAAQKGRQQAGSPSSPAPNGK